jgi:hypothetical protein
VYVAARCADLRTPHVDSSQRAVCAQCGENVWIDPVRYDAVMLTASVLRIVCVPCATRIDWPDGGVL